MMTSRKLGSVPNRTPLLLESKRRPSFHQETIGLGTPAGGLHFKVTRVFFGTLVLADGEITTFLSRSVKRIGEHWKTITFQSLLASCFPYQLTPSHHGGQLKLLVNKTHYLYRAHGYSNNIIMLGF